MNVSRFNGVLAEKGIAKKDVAKAIGVNPSTFYRKIKSGGEAFTIGEIHKMVQRIPLTNEEAISIFLPNLSH